MTPRPSCVEPVKAASSRDAKYKWNAHVFGAGAFPSPSEPSHINCTRRPNGKHVARILFAVANRGCHFPHVCHIILNEMRSSGLPRELASCGARQSNLFLYFKSSATHNDGRLIKMRPWTKCFFGWLLQFAGLNRERKRTHASWWARASCRPIMHKTNEQDFGGTRKMDWNRHAMGFAGLYSTWVAAPVDETV